jgi:hypothetical protein
MRLLLARAGRRVVALLRSALLTDDGALDVQQLFFAGGIVLVSIGAGAVYSPAGYLAPGVVLLWTYLPTRPPFVVRPPKRTE